MPHKTQTCDNLFLALPGIFHATAKAWGDWPEICHEYKWDFLCFDYPKQELDMKEFVEKIIDFIQKSSYKKVIICGLSFGELVARRVLEQLSETDKLVYHISVCGISILNDLSTQKLSILHTLNRVRKIIGGSILKKALLYASPRENHGIRLCGYTILKPHYFGKKNYMKHKNLSEEKEYAIISSGSIGLTPSLYDRCNIVLQSNSLDEITFPTIAIFAARDPFFKDPQQSAQNILDACTEKTTLICANPGGHASIVELPETYNPILKNILQEAHKN